MSNATCFAKQAAQEGPPLFEHGHINLQAHDIGWLATAAFAIIATVVSLWLVNKHLQWYTNKREQRYIVRLLFMVPIYAVISFLSYLFWDHATPILLIRDGYESTVLTAFFYLLLTYLSPSPDEQKAIFLKVELSREADREARRKGENESRWMFPLGFVKWKPVDGLHFLQLMKWGVLQYCVIRPTTTLAAVILNYVGLYCEDSWSPGWGHIYITVIVSVSVSIAMYCLIQLYIPISSHLAPQKPLLKLFAVKAVVFLTFWQATLLSVLSMFGVVKDTQYMTADDINIGWGAILETFEMVLFAFLHIKAFTYKPYANPPYPAPRPSPTPRLRSLGHAFDFRETFREIWIGCIYLFDRMRHREPRPDHSARRAAILENALGRSRPPPTYAPDEKDADIELLEHDGERKDGERQWLGKGDDYAYGLEYAGRREKSEALGTQIERELARRLGGEEEAPLRHAPQRSWWRDVYTRISQSEAAPDPAEEILTPAPRRKSRSRTHSREIDVNRSLLYDYDDPPPPSTIRKHRARQHRRHGGSSRKHESPLGIHVQGPSDAPSPPFTHEIQPDSLSPYPELQRSDSLLGRVFAPGSSASLTTQSKSASSHDTRVQVMPQLAVVVDHPNQAVPDGQGVVVESPLEMSTNGVPASPPHYDSPVNAVPPLSNDVVGLVEQSPSTEMPERPTHRRESAHYRRSFLVPRPPPAPSDSSRHAKAPGVVSLNAEGAPSTSFTPPAVTSVHPQYTNSRTSSSGYAASPQRRPPPHHVLVPTIPAPLSPGSRSSRPAFTREPVSAASPGRRRMSAPFDSMSQPALTGSPLRPTHRARRSLDPVSARMQGAARPSTDLPLLSPPLNGRGPAPGRSAPSYPIPAARTSGPPSHPRHASPGSRRPFS